MRKFTKTAALTAVFAVLASTTAFAGSDSKSAQLGSASVSGTLFCGRASGGGITSAGASSYISGASGTAYVKLYAYADSTNVGNQNTAGPNSASISQSYSLSSFVTQVKGTHSFSIPGYSTTLYTATY
jgi:hypothetical protein